MTLFAVPAESYDRFMGRFVRTLAPAFADAVGIPGTASGAAGAAARVLDVGAGPGGLTAELVRRVGADHVAAIDPSTSFVEACRARNPGVDVREAVAEDLPFPDDTFDAALACLVVGFMTDPVQGLREMARVTRPGGTVAACFWDLRRMPLVGTFWAAAFRVDPAATGERRPGAGEGELAALLREAGLDAVLDATLTATAGYTGFDDWWESCTLGVGPVGEYVAGLADTVRAAVRDECRTLLGDPAGPFTLEATCWFAAGTA